MPIKSIKKAKNLSGKRVLVRVDFNVPIKNGKVLDGTRLLASIPTIEYLLERGAKVILVTHIGRPEGKTVAALSVTPVVKRLSELLKTNVGKIEIEEIKKKLKKLDSNQSLKSNSRSPHVVMLENIRFHPGEEKNDLTFAKELANLGDLFVLDGFAVAHRAAASVAGVAKYLPSYAGLLLEKEITGLERVTKRPKKPFTLVLGGAKMETKVPIMKYLLPKVSHILVGGGIVNTYLSARGYRVGDSLVDKKFKKIALALCKKKKVIIPLDVIVGDMKGKSYRRVLIGKKPHVICKKSEAILDVGPATIRLYAGYIKKAKTVVWNGAMGYFEQKPYHHGTLAIARLVASRSKGKAFGVIGGGETLQAMDMVGMGEYVDLISTGGGAMLEYLGGKKLPGIEALR